MFPNDEIYIHIGMPKTASRTFQYHYFTQHDEICHIGKKKPEPSEKESEFIEIITDKERWEFQEKREVVAEYVVELFDQDDKYIVSAEAFSTGSGLSGKVDRYTIARRLNDIFPNGNILIVLRNQLDILRSIYRQRLKFDPGIDPFKRWIENKWKNSHYTNLIDYFDYYDLIRIYEDEFGYKNVSILFFEKLIKDERAFVNDISETLEITSNPELIQNKHENPSLTTVSLLWRKAVNKAPPLAHIPEALPKSITSEVKRTGKKIEVTYAEDQREYLTDHFGESNRELQSEFGIPLDKYNYPIKKSNKITDV